MGGKEHFTLYMTWLRVFLLVKLIDNLRNVSHDVIMYGVWIYDSNYNKSLLLFKYILDPVFSV